MLRKPEEQRLDQKSKHPMLAACDCTRRCSQKVSAARRRVLHEDFWSHSYDRRRAYARGLMEKIGDRRIQYFLRAEDGQKVRVCRVMWLATFGYRASSKYPIWVFRACRPGEGIPRPSTRGRNKPTAAMVDR